MLTARDMAVVIELTPRNEQTEFTLALRYTPRFSVIGSIIDRMVKGTVERAQQRSAECFASLLAGEIATE